MNSIIGYYSTVFGEQWDQSLDDLVHDAIQGVFKETKLESSRIDAVFFGNMLGGILDNSLLFEAKIAELLQTHVPVYRVEAACASGGMAFQMAHMYLKTHKDAHVLVLGAEKMTDVSGAIITRALGAAAAEEEQMAGLTFPGLYALIAQYYLHTYHYSEKDLASIPVKNHSHAIHNTKAHFRRLVSIDDVMESPYIAYPLKVLDSSPISDGAAAVILSNDETIIKKNKSARILSSEVATDTLAIATRARIDELTATKIASQKAFAEAHVTHQDIRVIEAHDCFSIAEVLALEDLGFWKKGEGGARAREMCTQLDSGSNLIVNTSGGLKAAGHPVGGTGIKQIGEIYLQVTGQAGKRQVPHANHGLAHNVGGSGGVAVVTILGT